MAQLLLDWLNNDLVLSRRVVSFADDFKDGYLFGEILFKYNQQVNFSDFSAHGNPSAKLNNFCLLEPTMRKIGVTFNARMVTAIMHGKDNITKNLLYEMKTQLERIYRSSKQNTKPELRGTASDKVLNVIKPERPLYDKTTSATFESAIRGRVENANHVMMENTLHRFTQRGAQYQYNMSMADEDLYEATMNTYLRTKEIDYSRKEHEGEFAEAWDSINLDQWKTNQRIARDRRNLKKKVQEDQARRSSTLKAHKLQSSRKGTLQSIRHFESRLEANILAAGSANEDIIGGAHSMIKTTTQSMGDRSMELLYIDNNVLKEGFESTTKKIKEHHEDGQIRQQMHDQRRRKFLREYDTMQIKMSQKIFHSSVIAQMLNFAKVETGENAESHKVLSYKQIIAENRSNREKLMGQMAEADRTRVEAWCQIEAQRELQWGIKADLHAHLQRSELLHGARKAASSQENVEFATELLDKLLDVVDFTVHCRSVGVFYYDLKALPGTGGRRGLAAIHADAVANAAAATAADTDAAAGDAEDGGKAAAAGGGDKKQSKPSSAKGDKKAAASGGTDAAGAAEGAETPAPDSCEGTGMLPPTLWTDAVTLFVAPELMAREIAIPQPLAVTAALWPFSISEQPHCVNHKWLFSQPFHGDYILRDLFPRPHPSEIAREKRRRAAAGSDHFTEGESGDQLAPLRRKRVDRSCANSVNEEASLISGSVMGHIDRIAAAEDAAAAAAVATAGEKKEGGGVEETAGEVKPPGPPTAEEEAARLLRPAARLSAADTLRFIEGLNSADIAEAKLPPNEPTAAADLGAAAATATATNGGSGTGTGADATTDAGEGAASEQKPSKDHYFTPPWLFSTEPRHILGEAVVAVRNAVEPLPAEPEPLVRTGHIPLRAALCGTSDLARRELARALQQQVPGLLVIEAAELVRKAYEHQMELKAAAASGAADCGAADGKGGNLGDAPAKQRRLSEISFPDFEAAVLPSPGPSSARSAVASVTATVTAAGDVDAKAAVAAEEEKSSESGAAADAAAAAADPNAAASVVADDDSDAPPPVVVEDFEATYNDLSHAVVDCLITGEAVPDSLYVKLIVHVVKQIPDRNNGFVLQDFPNTKEQALLLMEALSGIPYGQRRPQPDDKASVYAPVCCKEELKFDISKCGLDVIVHLNSGPDAVAKSFDERARARIDTALVEAAAAAAADSQAEAAAANAVVEGDTAETATAGGDVAKDTGVKRQSTVPDGAVKKDAVVYLTDRQTSVVGLTKLPDAERPYHTSGVDLTVADVALHDLLQLCRDLHLLDDFPVPTLREISMAAVGKAQQLRSQYIPPENLLPGFLPSDDPPVDGDDGVAAASTTDDDTPADDAEGGGDGIEKPEIGADEEKDVEAAAGSAAGDGAAAPAVEAGKTGEEGNTSAPDAAAAGNASENQVVTTEGESAATAATAAPAEVQLDEDGNPIETPAEGEGAQPATPEEEPKERYIYQMQEVINQPNAVPTRLAKALLDMWNTAETQSQRKSNSYFASMRDVRYQMVQRRRAAYDCLSSMLVRLDNRQELFDAFRKRFNDVDADMRFDPDCIAELHLQTLELCDQLTQQSEHRKGEGDEYAKKVSSDGVVKVLQHRCRCEAAAMVQSEFQRFTVVLHVLFDYTKSVKGYELHQKILNDLEETLPVAWPEEGGAAAGSKKDGKGKDAGGKKGKDAKPTHTPFREPLAAVLVPAATMTGGLTEVNGSEPAADPKAKGKKDAKKGGGGETVNPFEEIERAILAEMEKWRKGAFEASRVLYEDDEPLCAAVERAVWYEAEKVILSVANIKSMAEAQVKWLETAEVEMTSIMADMITKRHIKELAAINFLVEMIEQNIEEANPVKELWLVSPDVAPVDPTTVWNDFHQLLTPELLAELGAAGADTGDIDPTLLALAGLGLKSAQIAALAKAGKELSPEVLALLAKIGKNFSPKELTKLAKLAHGITAEQLALFSAGDMTPEQLITLLTTIHAAEDQQEEMKKQDEGRFKPEHTKAGMKQNASTAHRKTHSLSENVARKTRVAYGRPTMVLNMRPNSPGPGEVGDDAFNKEQQKYQLMRKKFEEKLQKRRHAREIEFKNMGMSPATAKLAAYNELLLDEQHELEDFDSRHKPKFKSTPGGSSKRRGNVRTPGSSSSLTKAQQAALVAKHAAGFSKSGKHHRKKSSGGGKSPKTAAGSGGKSPKAAATSQRRQQSSSTGSGGSGETGSIKLPMEKLTEHHDEDLSPRPDSADKTKKK